MNKPLPLVSIILTFYWTQEEGKSYINLNNHVSFTSQDIINNGMHDVIKENHSRDLT